MKKTALFASFLFFNLCFTQIGGVHSNEDPHKESFNKLSKLKENIYLTCKYSHEFGQVKSGSNSKINRMEKEEVQDRFNELRNVWNGSSYRTNDDYFGNTTRRIKFGRVDVDFFIISKERPTFESFVGAGRSATGDTQRWIYQSKENLLWAPEGSSFDEQIIFPRGKRSFLAHDALRANYSYNYEGLSVNMPFFLRSWSFDEGFFYFRYYDPTLHSGTNERLVLDRTDLSLQAQYIEYENCNYLKGYLFHDAECDKSTLVLVSQCEIVSPEAFEEAIKNEIVNRSNQLQNAKKVKERIDREKNKKEKIIQERKI